jgi:hypothetical protein
MNTPEVAIQTALDLVDPSDLASGGPGDVYIQAGRYDLDSQDFSGFIIHSYTNLRIDTKAQIRVRWGYAGAVFEMISDDGPNVFGVTNSMVDGGRLTEQRGPNNEQPQAHWTGFLLRGSSTGSSTNGLPSGMAFNKVANTEVSNAAVGVSVVVDKILGYVNSNTFEFLRLINCQSFVSFEMADLGYTTGTPIWGNRFSDLQCECGTDVRTQIGIRNVAGNQNAFDFVKVWDIQNGQPAPGEQHPLTLQVSPQADRTLVIGGILAGDGVSPNNVQDNGNHTTIFPQ